MLVERFQGAGGGFLGGFQGAGGGFLGRFQGADGGFLGRFQGAESRIPQNYVEAAIQKKSN